MDCTSEVTETGSGLTFKLKAGETIHFEFDADASFRCEVKEDDISNLTDVSGTGGTADKDAGKFTTTSNTAAVTFTNGEATHPKRGRSPRGARVTVRILGINNENNRIWGVITHMSTTR